MTLDFDTELDFIKERLALLAACCEDAEGARLLTSALDTVQKAHEEIMTPPYIKLLQKNHWQRPSDPLGLPHQTKGESPK